MDTQAGCSVELGSRCITVAEMMSLGDTGLKLFDSLSINTGGFDQDSK